MPEGHLDCANRLVIVSNNNKGRQPLVCHRLAAVTLLQEERSAQPMPMTSSRTSVTLCLEGISNAVLNALRDALRTSAGFLSTFRYKPYKAAAWRRSRFIHGPHGLIFAQRGRYTLSFLTPSKADLNLCSASPSTWACQPRSTILQSACRCAHTSSHILLPPNSS